jgi:site-specific recombinase XerD
METTELIRYRRALKRKHYSAHMVKNYVNIIDHFVRWLTVPLPEVTRKDIEVYVGHLLQNRRTPKTIAGHLQTIRLFFDYLTNEEGIPMENPVPWISLRLPKPQPRHLKDDPVTRLFAVITDLRDRAVFMLMLRCGLRVQEVTHLTVDAAELEYGRRQIFVSHGKGATDGVVYVSEDARSALMSCARRGHSCRTYGEKSNPGYEKSDFGMSS